MNWFKRTREVPRQHLERGDLVLFEPDGTAGAKLIEVLTHSHYHHVALYDGDGQVIEAMPSGVRSYPIGARPVIGLRPPVDAEQKHTAIEWAHAQIGDPYDTRGLFLIAVDRMLPKLREGNPRSKRYTCAVFVSEAYHHAGVELLPGRDWNNIVPGDFLALRKESPEKVVAD